MYDAFAVQVADAWEQGSHRTGHRARIRVRDRQVRDGRGARVLDQERPRDGVAESVFPSPFTSVDRGRLGQRQRRRPARPGCPCPRSSTGRRALRVGPVSGRRVRDHAGVDVGLGDRVRCIRRTGHRLVGQRAGRSGQVTAPAIGSTTVRLVIVVVPVFLTRKVHAMVSPRSVLPSPSHRSPRPTWSASTPAPARPECRCPRGSTGLVALGVCPCAVAVLRPRRLHVGLGDRVDEFAEHVVEAFGSNGAVGQVTAPAIGSVTETLVIVVVPVFLTRKDHWIVSPRSIWKSPFTSCAAADLVNVRCRGLDDRGVACPTGSTGRRCPWGRCRARSRCSRRPGVDVGLGDRVRCIRGTGRGRSAVAGPWGRSPHRRSGRSRRRW